MTRASFPGLGVFRKPEDFGGDGGAVAEGFLERGDGGCWTAEFGEEVGAEEAWEAQGGGDEDDLEGGRRSDEEVLNIASVKVCGFIGGKSLTC